METSRPAVSGLDVRCFMRLDPIAEGQEVSELVEPVQEAALDERIDGELPARAVGEEHALLFEVDRHDQRGVAGMRGDDRRVEIQVDGHGQEPVLGGVVPENVREGGGDDRAEACGDERPDRVLARRAAPEVPTGDEDMRPSGVRQVQREVRPLGPLGP